MDPGRADDFWTGSLAALFRVRVCAAKEQIQAASFSFYGGNDGRKSQNESGTGCFFSGRSFLRRGA